MLRWLTRSSAALCLIAFASTFGARADCGGTHTTDRCLVGTWRMTTNGAEQWMRAHIRNFHVNSVSANNNTITLRADGSFATGESRVRVRGTGSSGSTGTGTMNAQASGSWSAAGGNFNLCARSSAMAGTATVEGRGRTATTTLHPTMPAVSTRPYTCAGNSFTVSQPISGDTTSVYSKVATP